MNIFRIITGNIVKWWQLTVMPILRIDNNRPGHWKKDSQQSETSNQQASSAFGENVLSNSEMQSPSSGFAESQSVSVANSSSPLEVTDAQLVMERINREKEEQRKKDMEKAQEQARLAAILDSTKVNVDAFIQAGKEAREEQLKEEQKEAVNDSPDADAMARAEEIIARLNREAAEDEAKKQAEIEAAREQAKETFGS